MGILFVAFACLLWALDTLIRYPLLGKGVSAETIVFIEHLILVSIFSPVMWKSRHKFFKAKIPHIVYFLIIGGLGSALGTLAFTKAFSLINPSLVILLQKLQPLVAIGLARVLLKEKMSLAFAGWAVVCLTGGVLISFNDISYGISSISSFSDIVTKKYFLGYVLTLVAVISWGASTVAGKKLSIAGYKEKEVMSGRFFTAFLFLIPLFVMGNISLNPGPVIWGKIALMVFVSGVLGMYFYYKGLKVLSARLCALSEMFFPLFAVTINWIFLNQSLDMTQIVGAGLLLLGSSVIQLKQY